MSSLDPQTPNHRARSFCNQGRYHLLHRIRCSTVGPCSRTAHRQGKLRNSSAAFHVAQTVGNAFQTRNVCWVSEQVSYAPKMLVRYSFPPSIQPSNTMLSRMVLRALRPQGYYDTLQLNSAAAFRASTKELSTTPNTETPPAPSTAQTSEVQEDRSGWTEVVHEATGQTYYWNQRTGQTTALGDPRPHARSGGGGGGAGGTEGDSSTAGEAVDPRAETPLPDKTGTYAAIGVILGVFFGWASQFV